MVGHKQFTYLHAQIEKTHQLDRLRVLWLECHARCLEFDLLRCGLKDGVRGSRVDINSRHLTAHISLNNETRYSDI